MYKIKKIQTQRLFDALIYSFKYYSKIDEKDKFNGLIHCKNVVNNVTFLCKNNDIIKELDEYAKINNIENIIELCKISACFHDVAMYIGNNKHEQISAMIFKKFAKLNGEYSKIDINLIYNAIALHNYDVKPINIIDKILQDADKLDFYDIERLNVGTDIQIKKVLNLFKCTKNTLNFNISNDLFKTKNIYALEYYEKLVV